MKKLSIILFLVIVGISSISAQERMKFMGKSMDCSLKEMQTHLQGRGLTYQTAFENVVVLQGTFQGYLDCDFVIRQDYGIISFCRVVLPQESYSVSWSQLYADYQNIVSKISAKYGQPIAEEYFEDNSSYDLSDYGKMSQVRDGKCHYRSAFLVGDYGLILVTINDSERVFIDYYDNTNQKKIEDLQNDEL